MNSPGMNRTVNRFLKRLYEALVITFFISVQIAHRFTVGFSMIGMPVIAFLYHKLNTGKWWNKSFVNPYTAGCLLYFVVQAIALSYTRNMVRGMEIFQTNLGLLVLPVAVFYSNLVNRENWGRLMKWYSLILFFVTAITLAHAGYSYVRTGNTSVFFYHPLVVIYSDHAIQFSVLVFVGLLFLIEEFETPVYFKSRRWVMFLLTYFSFFLFLLTSKLIITIYFLYIIYLVMFNEQFIRKRTIRIAAIVSILAALFFFLFTDSPLRKRMTEDAGSNLSIINQEKFSPGDYFNGVQFRLISWRFAYEILNENHSWLFGVSPGDAQDLLNNKYRKLNMFTGGSPENKSGFIGYHTHNQFLQALLETGIPGLAAFMLICAGLIRLAVKSGNRPVIVLTILLLCYCFSDAVLTTQYGIILFVFFPLFLYKGHEEHISAS